jgi:hypothetical protein
MGIIGEYRDIRSIPDLLRAIEYFLDDELGEFGSTTGRDLPSSEISFCLDGVGDLDIRIAPLAESEEREDSPS